MVKYTQTIRPTNCLSVFNYFEGLALKGLNVKVVNIKPLRMHVVITVFSCHLENVIF